METKEPSPEEPPTPIPSCASEPLLESPCWQTPSHRVKFREAGFLLALKTQETHSLMLGPAGRHSRTQENGKLETSCILMVLFPVSEPTSSSRSVCPSPWDETSSLFAARWL